MVDLLGAISSPHSENRDLGEGVHLGFGKNDGFTGERRIREGQ